MLLKNCSHGNVAWYSAVMPRGNCRIPCHYCAILLANILILKRTRNDPFCAVQTRESHKNNLYRQKTNFYWNVSCVFVKIPAGYQAEIIMIMIYILLTIVFFSERSGIRETAKSLGLGKDIKVQLNRYVLFPSLMFDLL